jgi:hypothetical protein
MESGEDEFEFSQRFQGFGDVEGKHVLEFIHKSEIPAGYEATYARYTAAKRPEKEKPNRCRITAGGGEIFSVTIFVDNMVPFVDGIIGFYLPFIWDHCSIYQEFLSDYGAI